MATFELTADADAAPATLRGATRAWTWALARGLLIGVPLGVAFRGWMRLISTDPEFTWSGTIFIVSICTIAAVGASLARTARTRWHRRAAKGLARVLGTVAVLLVGAGAGSLVLPAWSLAGLAWGRRDWSRRVRMVLLVAAALATAGAFLTIGASFAELGLVRSVLAVPALLAILAVIAVLFSWPTGTSQPRAG